MRLKELCVVGVIVLSVGCAARHGGPVVNSGESPADVGGTISGNVRSAAGVPLTDRKVILTDVTSGVRFETSTASSGGYTVRVPKGKFRLEVELQPGEAITTQPDPTDVNVGDLDAQRNFVVTVR